MPTDASFSVPEIPFTSMADLRAACLSLPERNRTCGNRIRQRDAVLTKPPGSLGRLEELALWLGEWQGTERPTLDKVQITIFAGNHGVVQRGVSPWPSEVTCQMVANFEHGGAAINQLARNAEANLNVVCLQNLQATEDLSQTAAMTEDGFLSAVSDGYRAVSKDADLFCAGEMGIGNTTPAAALCAALLGGSGSDWAGRGTGLDDKGVQLKAAVIDDALTLHGSAMSDPLEVARYLGGYELAAIMGSVLAARHHGIPVLLDGFACTAAMLPLVKIAPEVLDHTRLSHCSAEAGHRKLAKTLALVPLLDFGLRLGEASGAALAIPLLRGAIACHNGMATFAEAAVSQKSDSPTE
ncbi:nicotinate-nucleotide--dimethylbenzimidazole phosphoribosyltransferase [Gluconobacter oxydans]|uniref:nicotinate-nucleotide--dimethylbenzimidazole phosphoribosyltransferase n=1 Tax=Gluconobacter thailandicus TaxID=257438 RepID=UPI000299930D|nr:nicotinate-nucleotide--dimethylbenzimidazole phosphoribosyltransferase [Gluconobacter thailandicus]AFW02463.1 nicotinate-nucleotide--dimethylbenzimidazole phosphoribosyltransferase [Gluconobacter oxydans H24]ANQ42036.1 nicotinate-nucleotide--dimethylbenzimidazole phosphoribosyltransferase [Gluconobacter oxydans]